jgi:hypothetical protein
MRTIISPSLLIFAIACGSSSGWAEELVVPPGGPTRMGVPACPPNALAAGFDAATGRLLCDNGFITPGAPSSWIVDEALDAPGATSFTVFPQPMTTDRVAHR